MQVRVLPRMLFCPVEGKIMCMVRVGFEPTPPKRLRPERSALDHSATSPLARPHGVAVALRIPNPTTAVRFRLRSSLCHSALSYLCLLLGSAKIPLLPGFEPGLPDSRSGVLTTTLQERRVATSPMAQSVARQAVNLQVAGSNPAGGDVWPPNSAGCGAELSF